MHEDRDSRRTSVERLLARTLEEEDVGRALSERARQSRRSVEAYLKAGNRPRWMERLIEIERGIAQARERLARAHDELRAQYGPDTAGFARHWRELAPAWDFDALNELIQQHNDWYPIERDLPMNPRTGDYVPINGRSYRRPVLDPEWVLREFPATPPGAA